MYACACSEYTVIRISCSCSSLSQDYQVSTEGNSERMLYVHSIFCRQCYNCRQGDILALDDCNSLRGNELPSSTAEAIYRS